MGLSARCDHARDMQQMYGDRDDDGPTAWMVLAREQWPLRWHYVTAVRDYDGRSGLYTVGTACGLTVRGVDETMMTTGPTCRRCARSRAWRGRDDGTTRSARPPMDR